MEPEVKYKVRQDEAVMLKSEDLKINDLRHTQLKNLQTEFPEFGN